MFYMDGPMRSLARMFSCCTYIFRLPFHYNEVYDYVFQLQNSLILTSKPGLPERGHMYVVEFFC